VKNSHEYFFGRARLADYQGNSAVWHHADEAVRKIIGNRGPKSYDKGAMLFQQGDKATAFFLILDGWVKLFRMNPEGLEAVIGVFSRGECFAEAAMFLGGRYPVSAEIVTP
jgi:CRP-like cAMP-binding protein